MQNNNQSPFAYVLGGAVLGALIFYALTSWSGQGCRWYGYASCRMMSGEMMPGRMMDEQFMMKGKGMMELGMDEMVERIESLRGDEFDQIFIKMMIAHHEGAVKMAEEAQEYAKHSEIKKLADEIISAQTKEIEMMKGWFKSWYGK